MICVNLSNKLLQIGAGTVLLGKPDIRASEPEDPGLLFPRHPPHAHVAVAVGEKCAVGRFGLDDERPGTMHFIISRRFFLYVSPVYRCILVPAHHCSARVMHRTPDNEDSIGDLALLRDPFDFFDVKLIASFACGVLCLKETKTEFLAIDFYREKVVFFVCVTSALDIVAPKLGGINTWIIPL